jgi:hypothetical protein
MHMVRGFAQTAADWVAASGLGKIESVLPAQSVKCPEPLTGGGAKLDVLGNYTTPPASVAILPNACAVGDEGAILTCDGQLLLSTIQRLHIPFAANPVWQQRTTTTEYVRHEGTLGVLTHHGCRNFGHVIADGVPRFWLMRRAGAEPDAWIVPATPPSWLEEILLRLGIGEDKRVYVNKKSVVCAHRLIVPTGTGHAVATAPWARTAVAELFKLRAHSSHDPMRIWISRETAVRRRWIQEAAAHKSLEDRGFVICDFDGASIETQFRLAFNSNVIAGAHGSAFCWTLASRHANGLVFELSDGSIDKNDYRSVAAVCKWQYARTLQADMGMFEGENNLVNSDLDIAETMHRLDLALDKWSKWRSIQ